MSKLDKLTQDFPGLIFAKTRKYRLNTLSFFSTRWAYVMAGLKGVKIGKGALFFGLPYFRRSPMSSITVGKDCRFRSDYTSNLVGINRRCILNTARRGAVIDIGDSVGMSGTVISAAERIEIGKDVLCGANVLITDFDWHYVDPSMRKVNGSKSGPVVIEENVWLGLNTVVLKGVRIGKNTVIAANSLVVKDIPANVIAGGNPCKVIKELTPKDKREAISEKS